MYNVKFTKVYNKHNRMRTDEVVGVSEKLPKEGEIFVLIAKGLEFGTRVLNTSPVKMLLENEKNPGEYLLHTESGSVYQVNVLGEVNDKHD